MFRSVAPIGPFPGKSPDAPDEVVTPETQSGKDDDVVNLSRPPILLPTPTATETGSSSNDNTPSPASVAGGGPHRSNFEVMGAVPQGHKSDKRPGGSCQSALQKGRRLSVGLLRPLLSSVAGGIGGDKPAQKRPSMDMIMNRGRVRLVKVEDLEIQQGGGGSVNRMDKKLGDASYLTETLTVEERRSVILPTSRFKNLWDVLISILVAWTAVMLPIQLCYDNVPQTLPQALIGFDVFTDIIFLADIILNFHVGYIDEALIVVDKTRIRRKYLQRWFFIDAVGSFPGDTIFLIISAAQQGASAEDGVFGNTQAGLLTLFKVLKIPKLMRLGRLFKSLEKLEGAANIANIIILLVIMVVVNHWISCLWFLMTKNAGGWVEARGLNTLVWTQQYPETFYTTLMMVMGDSVDPTSGVEYLLSSLIVVIGITMNATVFASIASYAAQISSDTAQHKNKMNQLQRSIKTLRLPDGLALRIQQYYEYCWTRHRDFAAQSLLNRLPSVFQRRCAMSAHEEKLRRFAPFAQSDERFIASLTTKLRAEVYMPEAFILVTGQVYTCAYFMQRGWCQVTWPSESRELVNVLTVDDYFGELSLFVTKKLSYTVRAITHVDCFRLERADFIEVMRSHPAGAVHVADHMDGLMPSALAKRVTREIYDYSGLRELLAVFMPDGKWRPPKGLAERIRRFAVDHEDQLTRIRKRQGRNQRPKTATDSARLISMQRNRNSIDTSAEGAASGSFRDGGGGGASFRGDRMQRELLELASGQRRLEAKVDELTALLAGKAGVLATEL